MSSRVTRKTVLKMRQVIGTLKNEHYRASAQSGLKRAARLPNSGFTDVENSQGASQVASELLASLDAILQQIDFESMVSYCF